jgi:hypothetical protein
MVRAPNRRQKLSHQNGNQPSLFCILHPPSSVTTIRHIWGYRNQRDHNSDDNNSDSRQFKRAKKDGRTWTDSDTSNSDADADHHDNDDDNKHDNKDDDDWRSTATITSSGRLSKKITNLPFAAVQSSKSRNTTNGDGNSRRGGNGKASTTTTSNHKNGSKNRISKAAPAASISDDDNDLPQTVKPVTPNAKRNTTATTSTKTTNDKKKAKSEDKAKKATSPTTTTTPTTVVAPIKKAPVSASLSRPKREAKAAATRDYPVGYIGVKLNGTSQWDDGLTYESATRPRSAPPSSSSLSLLSSSSSGGSFGHNRTRTPLPLILSMLYPNVQVSPQVCQILDQSKPIIAPVFLLPSSIRLPSSNSNNGTISALSPSSSSSIVSVSSSSTCVTSTSSSVLSSSTIVSASDSTGTSSSTTTTTTTPGVALVQNQSEEVTIKCEGDGEDKDIEILPSDSSSNGTHGTSVIGTTEIPTPTEGTQVSDIGPQIIAAPLLSVIPLTTSSSIKEVVSMPSTITCSSGRPLVSVTSSTTSSTSSFSSSRSRSRGRSAPTRYFGDIVAVNG